MNSFEYYESLRRIYAKSDPSVRLEKAGQLVRRIRTELSQPPHLLRNAPFLSACISNQAAPYDACILSYFLLESLRDPSFDILSETRCAAYLFRDHDGADSDRLSKETRRILRTVKVLLSRQAPEPSDTPAEAAVRLLKERAKRNHAAAEQSITCRKELEKAMQSVQPAAEQLLKAVLRFREETADAYILPFATSLIRLYELINDAYRYHRPLIEDSTDTDRINAVLNYSDFLYEIEDILARFGVETIVSDPGTPFDGRIHDPRPSGIFPPKSSAVSESLSAGFCCDGVILKKETVTLMPKGGAS